MKSFSSKQILLIITSVFAFDFITKYLAKTYLAYQNHIDIFGDFFRLTYVENPGMAFGLTLGNKTLFLSLSLIALVLVLYYLYKLKNEVWQLQLAISLITAGAFGNLSERFFRGSVVDFFDFEFFDITIPAFSILGIDFSGYYMTRWPVFNIADMAVSCGMIIIFTFIMIKGDPLKPTPKESTEPASHAG